MIGEEQRDRKGEDEYEFGKCREGERARERMREKLEKRDVRLQERRKREGEQKERTGMRREEKRTR